MEFYISIFIVLLIFSFIEVFTKKNSSTSFLYWSSCFFLFILSFLRWETGTDWNSYHNYFNHIFELPYNLDILESGFRVLNYTVRSFTDEYTIMLFILGAILFSFQSLAIKRLSFFPILSLTFLYASQLANILFVRQWIAVGILFYSIVFIKKNKFIPFLLLVLIASSIHRVSLIFIIVWWVFKMNISTRKIILFLCLSVIFSYFMESLLSSMLGGIENRVFKERLDVYLDSSYNSEEKNRTNFTLVLIKGFINRLSILFISLYIYAKTKDNILRGYINIYWIGCILFFSLISISPALARIAYYFDFVQIILISYIVFSFRTLPNKIIAFCLLGIYMLFRLNQFLINTYNEEIVPYKFVNLF